MIVNNIDVNRVLVRSRFGSYCSKPTMKPPPSRLNVVVLELMVKREAPSTMIEALLDTITSAPV